jgi:hypothetical protein
MECDESKIVVYPNDSGIKASKKNYADKMLAVEILMIIARIEE